MSIKLNYQCAVDNNLKFATLTTCQMRRFKAAQGNPDFQRCAACDGAILLPDAPEIEVKESMPPKTKKERVMPKTEAERKAVVMCGICRKPVLSGGVRPDGRPYRSHPQCREKINNRFKAGHRPLKPKTKPAQPKPEEPICDLCLLLKSRLEALEERRGGLDREITVTQAAYDAALSAQAKEVI
jgi:hypothetical protein